MDLSTIPTFNFRNSRKKLPNLVSFGPTPIILKV
jgi:hypothetical protein